MRTIVILAGLVCLVCVAAETPPELADLSTLVPTELNPFNTTSTTVTPPTTTTPTTPPTTTTVTTPSTTTTTPLPTTTSPSTTTLGPQPTPPKPNPEIGNWTVTDVLNNVTCIVARTAIYLVLPYTRMDGVVVNGSLAVPPNATATGTCGWNQTLILKWTTPVPGAILPTGPNTLTLRFRKNDTRANETVLDQVSVINRNQYGISSIDVVVVPDPINFPNALNGTISASMRDADVFVTSLNRSYRCQAEQRIPLIVDPYMSTNETAGYMYLTRTQLEAYHTTRDPVFSSAMDCKADGVTSDIVPIAVGCALAALVVVVLLAYLIGRRRARQRGYQSV